MATIQPPKPTGIVSPGDVLKRWRHRVLTRAAWSGEWVPADYMECISFRDEAAPTKPSAQLIYHSGKIKREDKSSFTTYSLADWNLKFVRVEILADVDPEEEPAEEDEAGNAEAPKTLHTWTGVISIDQTNLSGGTAQTAAGDQVLTAYGIEHLLDLAPISGSWVIGPELTTAIAIGRVIPFNERISFGLSRLGNRSAGKVTVNDRQCYVFDGDPSTAQPWTIADAVEYLLVAMSSNFPAFMLGGQITELGKLVLPAIDPEGNTVLQVLNELINPRRGFGFCVRMESGEIDGTGSAFIGDETPTVPTEPAHLHVFTVTDQAITTADSTIEANGEIVELDLRTRLDIRSVELTTDSRATYGRIVVSGEYVLVCCSASFADQTLEAGWTSGEQSNYINAVGVNNQAKDQARKADDLKHVFVRYLVKSDWGFMAGDGGGGSKYNANPNVTPDAKLDALHKPTIRPDWGIAPERLIPLLQPETSSAMLPDWREPTVYIQRPVTIPFADGGGDYISTDGVGANLTPLENELGFRVHCDPAHKLASGTFTGSMTGSMPKFDYRTMIITFAFRTDTRLQCSFELPVPQLPDEDSADYAQRKAMLLERTLFIQVPGAELWYIVPGTVVGLNDGSLQPHAGGAVRDDGEKLRQVLTGARAWFGKKRSALSVVSKQVQAAPAIGAFIRSVFDAVEAVPVNSVVTSKLFDLRGGETAIATSYAELDFGARYGSSQLTKKQERWR